MVSRFFQLVLLAGMILLIPSFLYLSHPATPSLIDPATGLAYSSDSILKGQKSNDLAQVSQGNGVDASHVWKGWNWHDASANVHKGVHRVEDQVKGLIDHWRPGVAPTSPPMTDAAETFDITPDSKVKPPSSKTVSVSATAGKDIERVDGVIMPKMGNATAKAALGRSTWHFLHTMTLRFPETPTPAESATLNSFFQNFAQLYPCGECAKHFENLITQLPPQVKSRKGASLWLCTVHNEVNKSLGKEEFPCDKLDESYDCGCGDDSGADKNGTSTSTSVEDSVVATSIPHNDVTPFA
ncbi:related to ERV2 - Flavin dependent sulfhydryl oxidase [Melanopsichium pennsylvanicum]|uniref:Sulfhydryl oxidase n=2 Tax=Melanopsichium pennsylvanicum TaxID=63383 RepID=A0AAJ4XIK7_9BASI|nr:related to ERV2-Flavin dependent sulfhydryl oxidase [Melanopsichium pennsylvanicum 4]SNX83062.1 related to ERV2 - Flavin dependent sulfhydryl oxidase [Melanopsichium pennsylvanicum]